MPKNAIIHGLKNGIIATNAIVAQHSAPSAHSGGGGGGGGRQGYVWSSADGIGGQSSAFRVGGGGKLFHAKEYLRSRKHAHPEWTVKRITNCA